MNRSMLSLLLLVGLNASRGHAQDPTKGPTGPAPSMDIVVTVEAQAEVVLKHISVRVVPFVVRKKVIVDGVEKDRFVERQETKPEEETSKYLLKSLELYNTKGEKLKLDAALKRLSPGTIVLLSADGKQVDPAYLRITKEDTLILVQPVLPPK